MLMMVTVAAFFDLHPSLHSFTVDPALDSLLPLAQRPTYRGKDGSNGNPAQGTGGSKKRGKVVPRTPPLRVGVPPGTVVRRKRGGAVLGELINVGDTLCVARGGRGALRFVAVHMLLVRMPFEGAPLTGAFEGGP